MRSLAALLALLAAPALAAPPNVVILVADDAGYADFSFNGCKEWQTPNIDRIAIEGVRCTDGHVSGFVCSPTRAGLLTGRYQQRFGHEFNPPPEYSETNGLPTDETTFADLMKQTGYRTAAFGKWHLGYAPKFNPVERGFDDYYGFLQGSRTYWPIKGNQLNEMLQGRKPVEEKFEYMTDELGRATSEYIGQHKDAPFFLYVCFNAVHSPLQAKEEDLARFAHIQDETRRKLAAMTLALDRAVGNILGALDTNGLAGNTLVAFISDNGGPESVNASDNGPLRGVKGNPFEGGMRVPFALRWPAKLPKGTTYDKPVIALDLLPTALAAAGATAAPPKPLDGVNLLPYLTGEETGRPHETLYWRIGQNKAVRDGDLKLVYFQGEGPMLFDLANDLGEEKDLATSRPQDAKRLGTKLAAWEAELQEPRWQSPQRDRPRTNRPNARPNRQRPADE